MTSNDTSVTFFGFQKNNLSVHGQLTQSSQHYLI